MSITKADHDRVWFVVVTLRDGTQTELAFEHRTLAESWLYHVPHMQMADNPDYLEVASARLRPFVEGLN